MLKSPGHFIPYLHGSIFGYVAFLLDDIGQRIPRHILHDEIHQSIFFSHVDSLYDSRVFQLSNGTDLLIETVNE